MQGLAPKTLKILDRVSALNSIQGFWLVGGTGIAIQINHRLSRASCESLKILIVS